MNPLDAELPALSPSLTDRIPPEIFDHIIDHLFSSKVGLSTCSLVCKSWLSTARYHFFASSFFPFQPFDIYAGNFKDIFALLGSPLCTVGSSVRSVSFRVWEDMRPDEFVPYLPNVEQLLIYKRVGVLTVQFDITRLIAYGHTLTELMLCKVTVNSFSEFLRMLPEFGRLRHIALVYMRWKDMDLHEAGMETDRRTPVLPHLQSLVLTGDSSLLVDWILTLKPTPHISSIDLRTPVRVDVSKYSHSLGPIIREIDLHKPHLSSIDLVHNPNLEQVWVHDMLPVDEPSKCRWVVHALSTTSSPCYIHTIGFYIKPWPSVDNEENTLYLGWKELLDLLADEIRFPRLGLIKLLFMSCPKLLVTSATEVFRRNLQHVEVLVTPRFRSELNTLSGYYNGRLEESRQIN